MAEEFALFIWIEDKPVTGNVFKLSNITKPYYFNNDEQSRDYSKYFIGQEVEARFDRKKTAKAIIGGIEDETKKELLEDVLRQTSLFNEMVNKYINTGKDLDSEVENQNNTPLKKQESRKRQRVVDTTPQKGKTPSANSKRKRENSESRSSDKRRKTDPSDTTPRKTQMSGQIKKNTKSPKRKTGPSEKVLERIGEDLTLLNLVSTLTPKKTETPVPVITTGLVRESLDLLNQGDMDPQMTFSDLLKGPPLQEHCSSCKEILNRLGVFESHIHWLTTNIQELYQIINNQVVGLMLEMKRERLATSADNNIFKPEPSTSKADHNMSRSEPSTSKADHNMSRSEPPTSTDQNIFKPEPPTSTDHNMSRSEPPTSTDHNMSRSEPPTSTDHNMSRSAPTSPTCFPKLSNATDDAPGKTTSLSQPVYGGYTMDMLKNKIRLCPDYKKATATLFRLLYTEEETRGRSLKGKKSTKTGPNRPGLEDLSRLQIIYDLIKDKFPGTEEEQMNAKIGHMLKPSQSQKD